METDPEEAVDHHVRVERLAGLPRPLHHGIDVLVPEDAVCREDLGDVAEELLRVDLGQDVIALQVAQAVQEQLR